MKMLNDAFVDNAIIELTDEKGDDRHFSLKVISNNFKGKNRLERRRTIYRILNELMKTDSIHAIKMHLMTHDEYIDG